MTLLRSAIATLGMVAALALSACSATGTSAEPSVTSAASVSASSTTTPSATKETVTIASLKGPTTMGLVGLMDQAAAGTADENYQVTTYGTADEIVPQVVQGTVDIALVPANLAAVLAAKTKGTDKAVEVLAINTLGVLNVVETGNTIHSVADLVGTTIYSMGKGTTPEYVLNHLLKANGLTPGVDVKVEYKSEATEVAAMLQADPHAIGVLPQPYVTSLLAKDGSLHVALDLTDEWKAVSPGSQLVTGVAIVRTGYAAEHPDVVKQFMTEYEASTTFVNDEPAKAAPLIVDAGIVADQATAIAAIPACNIVFISGADMRTALEGYLQVLYDADPSSVGGAMPSDAFYYGG